MSEASDQFLALAIAKILEQRFNLLYSNRQHMPSYHPFAVTADGQRFLIPVSTPDTADPTPNVDRFRRQG
jgi:hypothetical protein